ncbi:MAG: hypothetical protein QOH05_3155 [Acetobacteraceae bacterium]|jgi:hypothetical protein|nr:hypothetical protein [Acetobacteraceae bacterium]
MSSSLSYLTTLFNDSFGAGSPLLDAMYGIGGSSAGAANPVQALQSAEQNQTQDVKMTALQPMVKATDAAFTQAVNSAKSMTQLLANPAFMNVLLTANGMQDQIGYTALATKAVTSDLTDPKSLANTLADTRWKTLAQTYDFSSAGLATFKNPATIASISNAYATATWQAAQDTVTPGLSNALAFKTKASTITSVDQILGDKTMRTVVTTALGIPEQIAFQTLNAQETSISSRVDIKRFQDPKFVEAFVQRYLIANAANAATTAAASSTTSSIPDLTSLAVQGQGFFA